MANNSKDWDDSESAESEGIDDDRDGDYSPSSESYDDTSSLSDIIGPPEKSALGNRRIEFGADLTLRPVVKAKSNCDFDLWKLFGVLLKCGIVVKAMSDKIFCSLCFENEVLKG